MTLGRAARLLLLGLVIVFGCLTAAVRGRHDPAARRAVVRRALAQSLGMCSLALSSDGSFTREPLEGPSACLGDIPGGYCLHEDSDWLAPPDTIGRPFTLTLEKAVP